MNPMRLTTACAIGLTAVLAGCNSPPEGEQTRRVEIGDTTKAERRSAQVHTASLVEFSDQVAQQLANDLSALQEFNGPYRASVVFGDITNKTGIVPTSDFEAFRSRVRQKLLQSTAVRNKVRWVESYAKMEELNRKELGTGQTYTPEAGGGQTKPLDAQYTYFLNGEMYRAERGGDAVNLYMLSFNLSNAQTREVAWSNSPYEIKQTPGR